MTSRKNPKAQSKRQDIRKKFKVKDQGPRTKNLEHSTLTLGENTMAVMEFLELSEQIKEDPRGFVFFPWQGQAGVTEPRDVLRTFHLVSIAPGEVRGNHLHPGAQEYLFTFQGEGVLVWEEKEGEVRERRLSGHRILVRIPPGVAHALRNPGPEILLLLAWRERIGIAAEEPETVPRLITATG